MANFIRCDGKCGKESPEQTRFGPKYVANSWTKIMIEEDRRGRAKHLIFCDECFARISRAMEDGDG
jgi:hypothetical protein